MLVRFKSAATETITMFGNDAVQLLKLMGATGRIPGGLSEEDTQAAMSRLETAMEEMKEQSNADTAVRPADNEDWASDEDKDLHRSPPIHAGNACGAAVELVEEGGGSESAGDVGRREIE